MQHRGPRHAVDTLEFSIDAMTTPECASRATMAVYVVDPTAVLQIDLQGRELRLASALPEERFIAALAAAGLSPAG